MTNPTLEEPTASERVEVIQADREAAADAILQIRGTKDSNWQWLVRHGECDDGAMAQAFARHRLAFTQPMPPASLDVRERARECARRIVGEFRQEGWPAKEAEIARLILRSFTTQERAIPEASRVEAVIEAGDYLISLYKRLWRGGVVRDLPEAEGAWAHAKRARALPDAGDAGIPAGMKPWSGGQHKAPDDWDGGPVLFRSGEIKGAAIGTVWKLGWEHCYGSGDVIAYTPRTAATQQTERGERSGLQLNVRAAEVTPP